MVIECMCSWITVVGTISSLDGGEVAVQTGSSVTVSFSILGAYPFIASGEIVWTFTNLAGQVTSISPGDGSKYTASQDQQSLTITNAVMADAGTYTITATNVAGQASSSVVLIVVGKLKLQWCAIIT